jgi:NDP-sugar pyrophosphorylase family protein
MAGNSERFKKRGYFTPKPFIIIDGRPMIHWVCDMFDSKDIFVFIIQKDHGRVAGYRQILETAAAKNVVLEIEPNRQGPVFTTLLADDVIDDDEEVLVTYCDFYQHWNYQKFLWSVQGYDGGIVIFKGFQPASFGNTYYAYLRCNEKNEMVELREKRSFTDDRHREPASTGVYYIRSWRLYRQYAHRVIDALQSVGGEYYVSLIYNPMVADGLRVATYQAERFVCWGTPEDLEQYLFWSDFFRNDVQRILER